MSLLPSTPKSIQTYSYILHASRVLLEKQTGLQLVKEFPEFYGTRSFITALTSTRQLSLSWASLIQSIPLQPTSWRSILILSSHLRLGLPSSLSPSGFPTKTLYTLKVSHPRCVVQIQVREEYPICVQSQNTTKHKTKFITLLQHYNNMFRPKLSAIVRLYMKPIVRMP